MTAAFVTISYVLTFGGSGALAWSWVRRARRIAAQVPPTQRPWT